MSIEIRSVETPTVVVLPDGRTLTVPAGYSVELDPLFGTATSPSSDVPDPQPIPQQPAPIPGLDDPGGGPILFEAPSDIDADEVLAASQGGKRPVLLRAHNVEELNAMDLHDLAERTRDAHLIVELW
jgi:hypothetical protein